VGSEGANERRKGRGEKGIYSSESSLSSQGKEEHLLRKSRRSRLSIIQREWGKAIRGDRGGFLDVSGGGFQWKQNAKHPKTNSGHKGEGLKGRGQEKVEGGSEISAENAL